MSHVKQWAHDNIWNHRVFFFFFSQILDFDQVRWLSIVAAIMSFTYSSVGLGLGLGKVAGIYILIICSKLCRYMQVILGPIICDLFTQLCDY